MGKTLFSLFIVGLLLSAPVFADDPVEPPAHGVYLAGWGMNPTTWETETGTFIANGLYDPDAGLGGGNNWVVGYEGCNNTPVYINYADITLDLWIEMYCLQTYKYTHYMWHRIGNAEETVTFYICGTCRSNNGQCISLVRGDENLTHLYFRHDVLGRSAEQYGSDIPIIWHYDWGEWNTENPPPTPPDGMTFDPIAPDPYPHGDITICIPKCDHWFCFRGQFTLVYHVDDGHYQLVMAGCPAPEL